MTWSGGAANREWNRAAGQVQLARLPAEVEHQLYLDHLDQPMWCPDCNGHHPLREHAECRATNLLTGFRKL